MRVPAMVGSRKTVTRRTGSFCSLDGLFSGKSGISWVTYRLLQCGNQGRDGGGFADREDKSDGEVRRGQF